MEIVNNLRKRLCYFSGEDRTIVGECPAKIQRSFASIGLFVFIIFIGCFLSATSFTYSLFEGVRWLSVPLGVVWALIVTNIYLLLLYTISPTLLPTARKRKGKVVPDNEAPQHQQGHVFTPSMIFRMGFMTVLAIIIAQPLNVLFLSSFSEESMANFRDEYRVNMLIVSDSSIIRQELANQQQFEQEVLAKATPYDSLRIAQSTQFLNEKVSDDHLFLQKSQTILYQLKNTPAVEEKNVLRTQLKTLIDQSLLSDQDFLNRIESIHFQTADFRADFEKYKGNLAELITYKLRNYETLDRLLNKSNFYVKRIQVILKENMFSWIITLFVCAIFLLPIYFKFRIRKLTDFYERKLKKEDKFVRQFYAEFKDTYADLFARRMRLYNDDLRARVGPYIHRLRKIDANLAIRYQEELEHELKAVPIQKYEYWADPPFRHKHRPDKRDIKTEQDLIKRIYPEK